MGDGITLVTVAGKTHFNRDYTRVCIASWHRVLNVKRPFRLISDGLRQADIRRAEQANFIVEDTEPGVVVESLQDRPALAVLRARLPTWRHIIDSVILYRDSERILLIDTDVLVMQPVIIDYGGIDFFYNCDDIPGYRGKWYLPLVEDLVPSINPGFMVMNPRAVDLDELEALAMRYFVFNKNYWWTRQAALAVLAGRSKRRALFNGEDVRVVSGNLKRTPQQIRSNHWRLLGNSGAVTDGERMSECFDGAAVLHLAGRGKNWLALAEQFVRDDVVPRHIRPVPGEVATAWEKLGISARMFLVQLGRRRVVPIPRIVSS